MRKIQSKSMNEFIARSTGDVREAIERTEAADAYTLERYTRRFNGDKEYAKRYIAAKKRRARG